MAKSDQPSDEDSVAMDEIRQSYSNFVANIANYAPLLQVNLIPVVDELRSNKDRLDCQAGCSWCCHYRVVAKTYEIIAIYFHINTQLSKALASEIKRSILL